MATARIQMMTNERPRGPAAYFPSIEKRYGRPIAAWKTDLAGTGLTTYKGLMAWLKARHGFGHGHANALVIDFLNERRRTGADAPPRG
jgi:hypothetical protein